MNALQWEKHESSELLPEQWVTDDFHICKASRPPDPARPWAAARRGQLLEGVTLGWHETKEVAQAVCEEEDALDKAKAFTELNSYIVPSAPKEAVNHPSHYGGKDDPFETIKVIEARKFSFNLGTAYRYMDRHGKKDPTKAAEDLRKAIWYLDREASRIEKGEKS